MILIMTTLYNAERFIGTCINSIKVQTVPFHCVITDDMSTDNSVNIVKSLISDDSRFTLIENTKKMYQPGNYYQISKLDFSDDDIVVTLDGDDWFPDNKTLERVQSYYTNRTMMCFGQFVWLTNGSLYEGFTRKPDNLLDIRNCRWTTSHLRTFKLGLFRSIQESDLIAPTGNYWECTGDQAIIFPMIEMCSPDRIKFVTDVNMVYNNDNPINDHKVNGGIQLEYERLIRAKQKYQVKYI